MSFREGFNTVEGDLVSTLAELEAGLIDFALIFSEIDERRFASRTIPDDDRPGLLVRKEDPLASLPLVGKKRVLSQKLWDELGVS